MSSAAPCSRVETYRNSRGCNSRYNDATAHSARACAGLDLHPRSGFMLRRVDDLMSIGEFSARSGLSPNRLRSYAAAGVLVPAAVDSASGYRYYSPGQLHEAKVIDALRVAGMPL